MRPVPGLGGCLWAPDQSTCMYVSQRHRICPHLPIIKHPSSRVIFRQLSFNQCMQSTMPACTLGGIAATISTAPNRHTLGAGLRTATACSGCARGDSSSSSSSKSTCRLGSDRPASSYGGTAAAAATSVCACRCKAQVSAGIAGGPSGVMPVALDCGLHPCSSPNQRLKALVLERQCMLTSGFHDKLRRTHR